MPLTARFSLTSQRVAISASSVSPGDGSADAVRVVTVKPADVQLVAVRVDAGWLPVVRTRGYGEVAKHREVFRAPSAEESISAALDVGRRWIVESLEGVVNVDLSIEMGFTTAAPA